MGFYWSYTLLLKPVVLMRSCYVQSVQDVADREIEHELLLKR